MWWLRVVELGGGLAWLGWSGQQGVGLGSWSLRPGWNDSPLALKGLGWLEEPQEGCAMAC